MWKLSYYATSDESIFKELAGSFDLIINTVSEKLDKGLVHHFTAIEDEEILDKIYDDFMNDDCITTVLNNDLQDIINYYLSK